MKNILFLDDSKQRHEKFLDYWWDHIPHCAVRFCLSFEEALIALEHNEDWDVLFLDHDLGEEDQMCIPGETNKQPTGSDLADFIAGNPKIRPKLVVIHSFNNVGAKRMRQTLENVGIETCYIPFGYPYTKQVIDRMKKEN